MAESAPPPGPSPAAPGGLAPAAAVDAFLARAGWADARRHPLAGDASGRSYLRLARGTDRAVLMRATPAEAHPFARLAGWLRGLALSAPAVLAADADAGLLLLEDFGDGLVARLAEADPAAAGPLYDTAVDVLAVLHRAAPPPDLPVWTPDVAGTQAALVMETWAGRPEAAAELAGTLAAALAALAPPPTVPMLRDYHAENLIWLPDRAGPARMGLLDFQDAMVAPPGYDLVSLLRDARRDVAPDLAARAMARYCAATGQDPQAVAGAAAALGAARQLRILGVFARLARQGRPAYLRHMPRVWAHLQADLARPDLPQPGLGPLQRLVARHIPAPDAARLAALP
ncbi:MAG: aminoglycoside phosphotransferase family protein [Alkalilacustris sp.]